MILARGAAAHRTPNRGSGGSADLWRRALFTLGALIVYRIGTHLPVPGIDALALQSMLRTQGRISIFALNVVPYVTAWVIVEMVAAIVPRVRAIRAANRLRFNQYARIGAALLAAMQAFNVALGLEGVGDIVINPGIWFRVATIATLVTGTVLLMWLGEQITDRGLGNGIVIIIACGIVSRVPQALTRSFELLRTGAVEDEWAMAKLAMVIIIFAIVAFVERAARLIPVHYPKGADQPDGAGPSHLVLPVNGAGLLPAMAWITLFGALLALVGTTWLTAFAGSPSPIVTSALLIVLFAYLFRLNTFSPSDAAQELQGSGGILLGHGPGESTAQLLHDVATRLAAIGAAYLVVVLLVPEIVLHWLPLPLPASRGRALPACLGNGVGTRPCSPHPALLVLTLHGAHHSLRLWRSRRSERPALNQNATWSPPLRLSMSRASFGVATSSESASRMVRMRVTCSALLLASWPLPT